MKNLLMVVIALSALSIGIEVNAVGEVKSITNQSPWYVRFTTNNTKLSNNGTTHVPFPIFETNYIVVAPKSAIPGSGTGFGVRIPNPADGNNSGPIYISVEGVDSSGNPVQIASYTLGNNGNVTNLSATRTPAGQAIPSPTPNYNDNIALAINPQGVAYITTTT